MLIPYALQITMDDVGWYCGEDDRENGGSARTAMPRRHCAKDYAAINELGRRLNMKINCGFVLGEWDPDNRLKKVPYLSKFGDAWDNASYLGEEEREQVAEVVRNSPYIDIAIHGLLHNYYKPGIPYSNSDYYYSLNDQLFLSDEKEIRQRLDAFLDILDYYGIKKDINSFIPPSFTYRWNDISRILKDYGVQYISTMFAHMEMPAGEERPELVGVENGIITVDRIFEREDDLISWDTISGDPSTLPVIPSIYGCHWPNILHVDPDRHNEILERWVAYFEKYADTYGNILSRDMAFCATQSLYKRFAKVSEKNGIFTVDVTAVPAPEGRGDCFYISSEKQLTNWSGCDVTLYEERKGFYNYEVTPRETVMTFCE